MKSYQRSLLLCSTFLLTLSIPNGEAFTTENRDCFSLTVMVPAHYQSLKYMEPPVTFYGQNFGDATNQTNVQNEMVKIQDAWRKKNAEEQILQDLKLQEWAAEEKTYTEGTSEWYEFKAKVEGVRAEWYDINSDNYKTLKANQQVYLQDMKHVNQLREWDSEETTYTEGTPEWYEFKAKVEEGKAEWYDINSDNYKILKANQRGYTLAAEQAKQLREWDVEETTYTEGTPEWYEFKAKVEEGKAEWYDINSDNYKILKANQQLYLQQAEILRRHQEERQHRTSVGREQLQGENRESILYLIRIIFAEPALAEITLTDDDQAEFVFYIPQDIKDRLHGLIVPSFEINLTGDMISKVLTKDWSAASEIIVDFDTMDPREDESDISEIPVSSYFDHNDAIHAAQHNYTTLEIENFIESNLKSSLKDLVYGRKNDDIDNNWADIYRNFDPNELNGVRTSLAGRNLSDVTDFDLRCYHSADLLEIIVDARDWTQLLYYLSINLNFIDFNAIHSEWIRSYNSTVDPDPKRAFDSNNPFTDKEDASVVILVQGIKREDAVKAALESIFLKERAEALFEKMMDAYL